MRTFRIAFGGGTRLRACYVELTAFDRSAAQTQVRNCLGSTNWSGCYEGPHGDWLTRYRRITLEQARALIERYGYLGDGLPDEAFDSAASSPAPRQTPGPAPVVVGIIGSQEDETRRATLRKVFAAVMGLDSDGGTPPASAERGPATAAASQAVHGEGEGLPTGPPDPPWRVERDDRDNGRFVICAEGVFGPDSPWYIASLHQGILGDETGEKAAHLIVSRVNAHGALVAALTRLVDAARKQDWLNNAPSVDALDESGLRPGEAESALSDALEYAEPVLRAVLASVRDDAPAADSGSEDSDCADPPSTSAAERAVRPDGDEDYSVQATQNALNEWADLAPDEIERWTGNEWRLGRECLRGSHLTGVHTLRWGRIRRDGDDRVMDTAYDSAVLLAHVVDCAARRGMIAETESRHGLMGLGYVGALTVGLAGNTDDFATALDASAQALLFSYVEWLRDNAQDADPAGRPTAPAPSGATP